MLDLMLQSVQVDRIGRPRVTNNRIRTDAEFSRGCNEAAAPVSEAGWFYQRNVLAGRSACHVVSATGTGSSVMLVIAGGATVVGLCLVAAS